jgi:hypothetical protein
MRHGNVDDRSSGPSLTRWWGLGIFSLVASDRWSRFFAALLGEAPIDPESVILTEDIPLRAW